jgi:histidyl-tRNA synthetase
MTDAPRITPRTLKGFRDFLPEKMIPRERIIETAKRIFRSYGFAPIDTPALELIEILKGKGSEETDKQLYEFADKGGRQVGMRFDLTVPLARFTAQHFAEIGAPFKRYHIATVWRGENTQRGRFREFMQCDFDTIGTRSLASDIETAVVIHDLLRTIGFERFTIRLNHRGVLAGMLEKVGLAEKSTEVLRALDKLAKIGPQKVTEEIVAAAGATAEQAQAVLELAGIQGTTDEIVRQLRTVLQGNPHGLESADQLAALAAATQAAGVPSERLVLDVSIARGLDYYTGAVFETLLDDLPGIGSVCSGGRYDNLAEMYTKQELPGVGASLGLDRLLEAMTELGMIDEVATPCEIFLPYFDADRLHDYLRLATRLRAAGMRVELYPEPKKLGHQLKYADRKGFRVAVIVGGDEWSAGVCQVKDLASGDSETISLDAASRGLEKRLAALVTRTPEA